MYGSSYETQGTSKYQINDNWTNAIFQGDLVGMGDGTVTDRAGTTTVAGIFSAQSPLVRLTWCFQWLFLYRSNHC